MNLEDDDLDEMVAAGHKVNGYSKPTPPPKDDTEERLLMEMCRLLKEIAAKPDPVVNVAAPEVNVAAPEVTVKAPSPFIPTPVVNVPAPIVNVAAPIVNTPAAPKPFSEWRFTITNSKGETKTIIAQAIK